MFRKKMFTVVIVFALLMDSGAFPTSVRADNTTNQNNYPNAINYVPLSPAGSLDPTFDADGKVNTDFGNYSDIGTAIAIQSDGKIVTAGSSFNGSNTDFALARYNTDGSLDTTFDTDGKATTDFDGSYDAGMSVAIQPDDGKIVVAGDTSDSLSFRPDFALARYNTDGSLDTTFDTDGKVTTGFDNPYTTANDHGRSIVIQTDGKIVVAGNTNSGSLYFLALARYNSDGSLDTTFDLDGKVITSLNGESGGGGYVAIQTDDKIVVAGSRSLNGLNDFAVVRYKSDGSLDDSFGGVGEVFTAFDNINSNDDYGNSIAIQPDGKIIVAGSSYGYGTSFFALARYNSDGSLDACLDTDGKVITDFNGNNGYGNAVAIQKDGRFIVAGISSNGISDDFALARYNINGSLDTTFDTDGKVTTDFNNNGYHEHANSIAIQTDGKIIAAGYISKVNDQNIAFSLARYEYSDGITISPPTIDCISRANVNPTNAGSVDFTVTFSESVTGVDVGDFTLTTTGGVSGAAVSGVSGTGSVYIVTVNTGSGNGTIRLDVVDNNSILDAASNPLGGAAVGDGNFTTGEVYTITKSAGGDTTGVFRPGNGLLYLKNANTTGFADVAINYGTGGDYPIAGDWDGNGTATIGIYRNGSFYLRNSNTLGFADIVFAFGTPGDQPVAGDWDGDGVDTIGVYSNGQFLLRNSNSAGTADMSFYLGNPGDVGIAGDWNGDGSDTTGVFRPSNGIIFLKNANTTGFADIALNYGLAGDMPVTGDWNDDGIDTIGVYRNAQFMLRNSNTIGFAEIVFALGNPGDMPISGNWDGIP